jgi:protein O-mannosyl-transferase
MSLALVAITLSVYAPVRHFDFVPLDDPLYVSENPNIAGGLTPQAVAWAFTTGRASNWHPVTWLSHLADVQLFGVEPGAHHVVNLLLHLLNTLLLFGLLQYTTQAAARSAFVAALFAVHPLHVESVAWIAERKDVLSTLFLLLTIAAYVAYVKRPAWPRYILVLALYAVGLMAKPMLVTLPLVLLLIDVWPLGRVAAGPFDRAAWARLVREKAPLLLLAGVSSAITFVVQQRGGALAGLAGLPLGRRLEGAPIAYLFYLAKIFWPAGLTVLYSRPSVIPLWQPLVALTVLAAVTVAAIRLRSRAPYLAVGWLWFLITLVPVIGIVQVGLQAAADRYTYVPSIGLFLMIAWGVPGALAGWSRQRAVIPAAAALAVLACAVTARAQVGYWRDGVALWEHAVEVTFGADAFEAHHALGNILAAQGRASEAAAHFAECVRLKPDSAAARRDLALTLGRQGRIDDAIVQLTEAVRLEPSFAAAQAELGAALSSQRRVDAAITHLTEAVRLEPGFAEAHNNLGFALAQAGRVDAARSEFAEAVRLRPDLALAQDNLGTAEAARGRIDLAIPRFAEAVRLEPNFELARQHLAVALATSGQTADAIQEFTRVLAINPANETARRGLAALQGKAAR